MLRIVRDDTDGHRVTLRLEGHVAGEWADLLERECLECTRNSGRVVLDLSGVVFIGRSGIEALGRLTRAGVEIEDCPPLIADVLGQEGIEVGRRSRDARDFPATGRNKEAGRES